MAGPLIGSFLGGLQSLGLSGDSGPTQQTATSGGGPVTINLGNRNLGAGAGDTAAPAASFSTATAALAAGIVLVLLFVAVPSWFAKSKKSRPRRSKP